MKIRFGFSFVLLLLFSVKDVLAADVFGDFCPADIVSSRGNGTSTLCDDGDEPLTYACCINEWHACKFNEPSGSCESFACDEVLSECLSLWMADPLDPIEDPEPVDPEPELPPPPGDGELYFCFEVPPADPLLPEPEFPPFEIPEFVPPTGLPELPAWLPGINDGPWHRMLPGEAPSYLGGVYENLGCGWQIQVGGGYQPYPEHWPDGPGGSRGNIVYICCFLSHTF